MADDETVIDVDALKIDEFKKELGKLKLRCTRNKTELHERLRAALRRKEDDGDDAEGEESDTEDEDDEDADAKNKDAEKRSRAASVIIQRH